MGFLAEANEARAAEVLARAVESGEVSFLCIRCDRTSTDPAGAASSLCPVCRSWIAGVRLWPVGMIWAMAVASGPFIAGAMAALNWRQIGDRRKARLVGLQLLGAGAGVLFFGPAVFLPPIPFVGLIWLGVTAAIIGYATAGARRWGQAGMTTLLGAALWAGAGYVAEGYVRVAALAVGPVALSILALEWRRRRAAEEPADLDNSFRLMPTAAIAVEPVPA